MEINTIYCGDALEILKRLPDGCVNCVVTSPPYYRLRNYGHDLQIGLEDKPEDYILRLVEVFHEVKRVLKKDGTLWLNISDSYSHSGKGACFYPENAKKYKQGSNKGLLTSPSPRLHPGKDRLRAKNLIGIPWMLAFALRADGWYLRQDIIWAKPNPMPESVTDRCTKSHEYIFLFSKSAKYYYDAEAIAEPVAESTLARCQQGIEHQKGSIIIGGGYNKPMKAKPQRYGGRKYTKDPEVFYRTKSGNAYEQRAKRNKRDVWTITTKPFKGSHFATFPFELASNCVLAGCPEGGVVLDPFIGSGTTGVVARKLNRNYIGIEINPEYQKMATRRIFDEGENLFNGAINNQ